MLIKDSITPSMYFYNMGGEGLLRNSVDRVPKKKMKEAFNANNYIYIGEEYPVDMDNIEHSWSLFGCIVFVYPYDSTRHDYYIMTPTNQNTPWFWKELCEEETDTMRIFFSLLEKRFHQRLRTRKIIKEYTDEAKRRASNNSKETEEEILISLLERAIKMKKGEEIFWYRDYEYALLEEAIKITQSELEYKFRPGNSGYEKAYESFTHTIEDIINRHSC